MADRYHCVDGVWMLDENSPKFRSSDVELYGVSGKDQDGLWHVELVLKDGTKICPDLTGWSIRDDAFQELRYWIKSMDLHALASYGGRVKSVKEQSDDCDKCVYHNTVEGEKHCYSCYDGKPDQKPEPATPKVEPLEEARMKKAREVLERGTGCMCNECVDCPLFYGDHDDQCGFREYASKVYRQQTAQLKDYEGRCAEMEKDRAKFVMKAAIYRWDAEINSGSEEAYACIRQLRAILKCCLSLADDALKDGEND